MNIPRQSKSILILTTLTLITFNINSLTIDFDQLPNPDEIRKQVRTDIAWLNEHYDRKDAELARKDQALRSAQKEVEKAQRENGLLREQVSALKVVEKRITEINYGLGQYRQFLQKLADNGAKLVVEYPGSKPTDKPTFVEFNTAAAGIFSKLRESAWQPGDEEPTPLTPEEEEQAHKRLKNTFFPNLLPKDKWQDNFDKENTLAFLRAQQAADKNLEKSRTIKARAEGVLARFNAQKNLRGSADANSRAREVLARVSKPAREMHTPPKKPVNPIIQ